MAYLQDQWLGRGWLKISENTRGAISGNMCEIYANAFEHGRSPISVVSCGQYYPNLRVLKFTVVDFGVGIPQNVRDFRRNDQMRSGEALRWAFESGTTTRPRNRGLGLNLLKEFVTRNSGRLEIFSYDAYASIDRRGKTYSERASYFEGTLVNITLQCDEGSYTVDDGLGDEPLF